MQPWEMLTQRQRRLRTQVMQGLHYNGGVSYWSLGITYDLEAYEVQAMIEDRDIEKRLAGVGI